MLEQFTQIRILLANIQSNMSALRDDYQKALKEIERLQIENKKLKEDVERKTDSKKTT